MILEVAAFSLASAHTALRSGASRIELCRDRVSGGLTPSITDVSALRRDQLLRMCPDAPIHVMIRESPAPTFTATGEEFRKMRKAVREAKPYASGFVFGLLTSTKEEDKDEGDGDGDGVVGDGKGREGEGRKDRRGGGGEIDVDRCKELVFAARPLPCTFHRAFDHARGDLYEKLEIVRRCGFSAILTSGCKGDAVEGRQNLAMLVQMAEPMKIEIIVGGGIRSENVEMLRMETKATSYHTSAVLSTDEDGDKQANDKEVSRIKERLVKGNRW